MSEKFFGYRDSEGDVERDSEELVWRALAVSVELERVCRDGERCASVFTFAESCTGGLISSWTTSVPGASAVFPGSVVVYSDRAKIERLSVSPETIERYGAVSAQCAVEMAWGALRLFGSLIAVSVTGIAGPGGGSDEKPVGTVWFALVRSGGGVKLKRGLYRRGSRRAVRLCAARSALDLLVRGLDEARADLRIR
ncbi:MAG: nicotinamide-nucleotide amidohydrolase family protein [Synergistaceae bacterium]|jgi:PncC family amidohydrolase|nr:nicotinamide-nucleotide amidohydrolase family protein [Synergistaceae bacterium]